MKANNIFWKIQAPYLQTTGSQSEFSTLVFLNKQCYFLYK